MRALARRVYHALPLSQHAKWKLRARLHPLLLALRDSPSVAGVIRALVRAVRGEDRTLRPDASRERALASILEQLGAHALRYGPVTHWIALPFLSTGGAEQVALNFCRAVLHLRPGHSVALFVTDRGLVSDRVALPDGAMLVVFDDHLDDVAPMEWRQALLKELLLAVRPHTFHNINSETAWHLIVSEGERLRKLVKLHASIFAFQFADDGRKRIGYAAYFLQGAMPSLASLSSDNRRFIDDACKVYGLEEVVRSRLRVLYQPCRLFGLGGASEIRQINVSPATSQRDLPRLTILWAGRLDAEKRLDLFLEVVRRCDFADFHVFGQLVLERDAQIPDLPNLKYDGPFESPLEWIERRNYDVFIFTSKWEGLPNVLVEAGALNIPIIAPVVGGVGELVTPETGYPLSEKPGPEDYLDALAALRGNPAEAARRAGRLRALVEHRHSWTQFLQDVATLPDYLVEEADSATDVVDNDVSCDPLVSVIIPCYNQGRYLPQSVASALAACRQAMEVIVVDDGSIDPASARWLSTAIELDPTRVRVHRQSNQGLSAARNAGLAQARGRYVQFLDADDLLVPGKIDVQLAQLQSNPRLDVSVCNFLLADEDCVSFSKPEEAIAHCDLTEADFLYRWERGMSIPIHCGLFRRRLLTGFDTEAHAKEDWLFWVDLCLAGTRFGYVHGHLAIYRQHPQSMRRSYLGMGRAWLQAGLKIDARLAGREPLFFDSVVTWFEQCYRGHPDYQHEIRALQAAAAPRDATAPLPVGAPPRRVQHDSGGLIQKLPVLADEPLLFSVIVPVFNHYEYLAECLESLVEQAAAGIEIICVDDGSTDPRVAEYLRELKGRSPRLKIHLADANRGISVVQNEAVTLASGAYLAFVDCDDTLPAGALLRVRAEIERYPDVDYFFSDRHDVDEQGAIIRTACYGGYDNLKFREQALIADDLLDGMVASHLKVIRRQSYLDAGGCDVLYDGVQDWDLALKIAARGRLRYIPEALYRHRIHAASVTRSSRVAQIRKTNQVRHAHCGRLSASGGPRAGQLERFQLPVETAALRACLREGARCAVDARGPATPWAINFLREFNGYLDRIEWDEPELVAGLIGYVWDPAILHRAH